jgi:fatty-acyl-CoA synthase
VQVAKFARPDDVVVLPEIPHTATGKVSKLTLRKMFEGFKPRPAGGLSKL